MPVFRRRNYTVLCSVLFAAGITMASEAPEEAIARCAKIASVGDRILCLENALRRAGAGNDDVQGTAENEESAAPLPVAKAVAIRETESEIPAKPESISEPSQTAAAEAVEPTSVAADASNIGAKQVEARSKTPDGRNSKLASVSGLRVASYTIVPYERLVVELENGQVWRQIKGDTQRFRVDLGRNQTVDISQSRFGGGYQLRLNEMRRTIRVERIK